MKKWMMAILSLVMACSAVAFSGCEFDDSKNYDYVIGINKFAEFEALNKAEDGFIAAIDAWAEDKGVTVKYDKNSARGESNDANTIAASLAGKRKMDLIYAIATPSATPSAAQAKSKSIPVLYTAVTDPVGALLTGQSHVTGTSDMADDLISAQMELLLAAIDPGVTNPKIGMLFSSNETNSKAQVDEATAYLLDKKPDLNIVEYTSDNATNLTTVLNQITNAGVHAVYSPTDNLVADNIGNAGPKLKTAGIPFIVGEPGMVSGGGLVSVGIDYTKLGEQTAKMAIKILEGASPATVEWEYYGEDFEFALNQGFADALSYVDEAMTDAWRALADRS